ncbi:MAG: MBL fold metallo-hydrolase [Candidatus Margulisiibacteriota bacterium]
MNYDDAVEIAEGVHWIGFFDEHAKFQCNPYLLIDGDEAVLFDPGSVPHFPIVARKVISVIDPKKISTIIVTHQDPDLSGSIPVFEDLIANPKLKIVSLAVTTFFLSHYGMKSPFYLIDNNKDKLVLDSGRELKFIRTPYMHSPGAFTTYDAKTKILFSGDIFGCFSAVDNLFAGDDYLNKMKGFHSNYIPSQKAMISAMEKFEKLDLEMIATQHGSIIKKDKIKAAIDFLKNLECGLYLKR